MTIIQRSVVVPYTTSQMYNLVDKVEEYSEFLPFCTKAVILSRTQQEVRASIHFTKGGIEQSFSTINQLERNKMIKVHLLEGPFKELEGFWKFEEMGKECKIIFHLEFILSNRLLSAAIGPFLQSVINNFVDAFCERAEKIYGKRS